VDCDPNYVSVGGIALEDFYAEVNNTKPLAQRSSLTLASPAPATKAC
jgi:hypothetical protein